MKRGVSLIGVIYMIALLTVLQLGVHTALTQSHRRLENHKHKEASYWLAVSGADYAERVFAQKRWKYGKIYRSPSFDSGYFVVEVEPGAFISRGHAGGQITEIRRKR